MHIRQFHKGAYIVTVAADGSTCVVRRDFPSFQATLLPEKAYRPELGEVFCGPQGECVVSLTWTCPIPDEDDDNVVLLVLGALGEDLTGWRSWCRRPELSR